MRYVCPTCKNEEHSAEARFCKICGRKIEIPKVTTMKAISLWQPWASLIVSGAKKIETRSWNTNIRGRVAIHASQKRDRMSLEMMDTPEFQDGLKVYDTSGRGKVWISDIALTFGCIVGTVEIIDSLPIHELIGTKYDIPRERAFGDWREGRWGWILQNPILFKKPIPAKGAQGFWIWEVRE
jgi:hypothetical protein